MSVPREHPGEETAKERYARLRAAGEHTGWTGYCTVGDYCTRPCVECRREGEIALRLSKGGES